MEGYCYRNYRGRVNYKCLKMQMVVQLWETIFVVHNSGTGKNFIIELLLR